VVVLASLAMVASGGGAAADHTCGATITSDLELEHDLVCAGDGLIVGADGITIDLDGHTIAGAGSGVGISITGRTDVTIRGGVLRNFAVAIRTNASTDVEIRRNTFLQNGEGIDMQAGSVANRISENAFEDSTIRAIMLRGQVTDNDIRNNTFTANRLGILIFAGMNNDVKDNVLSGSSAAGIRLNGFARDNRIKDNAIVSNAAGIEFAVAVTGATAEGNELKDNRLAGNTCAIRGSTAGNSLKDNSFEGNVAASCS
jgi:parallel beta-helix repeat protein